MCNMSTDLNVFPIYTHIDRIVLYMCIVQQIYMYFRGCIRSDAWIYRSTVGVLFVRYGSLSADVVLASSKVTYDYMIMIFLLYFHSLPIYTCP